MMNKLRKVLVLGSGALKIGEAGEFDYSGSQALKALKEESVETVLINPNIATIQTSQSLADKVYFLPVNPFFVEKVIKKEKPDGIFLSFGGQTALNCGLSLAKSGILEKNHVKVLGTAAKTIEITEDRKLFAMELEKIGVLIPKGGFASSLNEVLEVIKNLQFPLLVRSGYSLGGLGSAVVYNQKELTQVVSKALKHAPQVAIEEYLKHWKEIEYEIVRDGEGNKITVCNMENLDPLGIHTGESIVVAPSQTLNNYQYHLLRQISLKVIEQLKIVGECNIQFALNPQSNEYRVIEVNARLSRSSALASKATGYPLAYVAAKIGLGYTLSELKNSVTKSTSAFFEPSLDYIVVKVPKWDLQKFVGASETIGSEMKSVGEVMAIGRSFPESLQKAIRSLGNGQDGLLGGKSKINVSSKKLLSPNTQRIFSVAGELAKGTSVDEIYNETGVDRWYLYQLLEIVNFEKRLKEKKLKLSKHNLLQAKKLGFSDNLIAQVFKKDEQDIRQLRKGWAILPKVKHIDTLAAEYPAKTNYLYLTYHGEESEQGESGKGERRKVIVLGSGPYRIGSSVEFDWCCVTAALSFKKKGWETIIINCNPETVSTDYDNADKLYFEELTLERVLDIYDLEGGKIVLSFGGQIPNNLAIPLYEKKVPILGTDPVSIDIAENRHKFSKLLDSLNISQPAWQELKNSEVAHAFSKKIGFPVMVRPSYVLSGSAMNVAYSVPELKRYLTQATQVSPKYPVVISKFIENAKEIEIDGVASNGELVIYAISEHIENAGVHSGDATLVLPPQRLFIETIRQVKNDARAIIKALDITGPFNIQFLAKDNKVMVIELNLRASRSFPFVSKVTKNNFVEIAVEAILGNRLDCVFNTLNLDYVGVKASQFSFNRIKGADPKLRVEMLSTGEVGCFGEDLHEAFLKAILSTGGKIPQKGVFVSIGGDKNKMEFLEAAQEISKLNLKIYATKNTSQLLKDHGIKNTRVFKISEGRSPSAIDLVSNNRVDLAINISIPGESASDQRDGYVIRRVCIDTGVPLLTNLQSATEFILAISCKKADELNIKCWDEYVAC
ncbi:carbamoyl-phosphate synthase (glutamine-hydrolyzing) large subunit [Candidatus Daviesbacteria bacterium]|nr:carbamoyl-phosphate synthase (glutamine-hydrolyzing) large subunit [Candidatus Daviesbacteria bacterium]